MDDLDKKRILEFRDSTLGLAIRRIIGVFLIALLISAVVVCGYYPNKYQCKIIAEKMKLNYSYGLMQNCMVEVNPGKWVPLDKYRMMDEK